MQKGAICKIDTGKKDERLKRLQGLTVEVMGVNGGVAYVKVIENKSFSVSCDPGLAEYTQRIDETNIILFPQVISDIEDITCKSIAEVLNIIKTETETYYSPHQKKRVTYPKYDSLKDYLKQNKPNYHLPTITTKTKTSRSCHYVKNEMVGFSFFINTEILRVEKYLYSE